MKKIGIVMGSDSDLPIAEKAIDTLKELVTKLITEKLEKLEWKEV